MTVYIINTVAACITMLLLFRAVKKRVIVKSRAWVTVSAAALIAGIALLDCNGMAVWTVLVLHSYTDITERHVYSVFTWLLAAVEVVRCIVLQTYMVVPLYTLAFSALLVVVVSAAPAALLGLIYRRIYSWAYAAGDIEIFILLILDVYNMGLRPELVMIDYLLDASIVFVTYKVIEGIIRKLRHEAAEARGAFVPAMAVAYFMLALRIA